MITINYPYTGKKVINCNNSFNSFSGFVCCQGYCNEQTTASVVYSTRHFNISSTRYKWKLNFAAYGTISKAGNYLNEFRFAKLYRSKGCGKISQ